MSKKTNPAQRESDTSPAKQTDESRGPLKGPQVTDRNMREKDLSRGSETQTQTGGT